LLSIDQHPLDELYTLARARLAMLRRFRAEQQGEDCCLKTPIQWIDPSNESFKTPGVVVLNTDPDPPPLPYLHLLTEPLGVSGARV
jgi:hypothetical protein